MKKLFFFLFTCCILHPTLQKTYAQDRARTADIATLEQLEFNWLSAEFKRDTVTIARMMDEQFISVGLADISSKQQELDGIYAHITARQQKEYVVDSLFLDSFRVQFFDSTAVVTFFSVTSGRNKGVPFYNRRTRIYDVWMKRAGQWKALSSQVTPVSR
ncbi:MAG: hypothetical protein JWQ27_2341 [Ferruginibacter sp.]|nr:hypothetical protein [Ferruginibacter sp.]